MTEGIDLLTPREREVADLIGQGLTTKEIAKKLFISKRTVDLHRYKIGIKFGVFTPRRNKIKDYLDSHK